MAASSSSSAAAGPTDASLLFLGQQCALAACRQNDFLPLRCPFCTRHFCASHARADEHACAHADDADVRRPTCGRCGRAMKWQRGEAVQETVRRHLAGGPASECARGEQQAPKAEVCHCRGCTKRLVVKITVSSGAGGHAHDVLEPPRLTSCPSQCPACHHNFCPSHRAPQSHTCAAPAPAAAASGAASARQGKPLAATSRLLRPNASSAADKPPSESKASAPSKPAALQEVRADMQAGVRSVGKTLGVQSKGDK
jgi:hypothetical protein